MFSRIYIHIPFCRQKCPYCAFFSQPHFSSNDLVNYSAQICHEIRLAAKTAAASQGVHSVYFGGGTPSLLAPAQISEILHQINISFGLAPNPEITLEANPGTVTLETLAGFRVNGINRLSLGVQSFDDQQLALLGRIHTAQEARTAFAEARRAGFDNIGIDLINSLPGQTIEQWHLQLEQAIQLAPEHISVYGLSIEEGTPFAGRYADASPLLPDDDLSATMFEEADDLLTGHGFEHYEIANYARPGFRSRHNSGYWHRDGYLGLGAGAHSFLKDTKFGTRFGNQADLLEYASKLEIDELPRYDITSLSREDAMAEWMFLGLRMYEGICFDAFEMEFGTTLETEFGHALKTLQHQELLSLDSRAVRLTRRGMLLSNQVFQRFLP
jgi:oxygen-independent coproporphyrinogen-3 oxidase